MFLDVSFWQQLDQTLLFTFNTPGATDAEVRFWLLYTDRLTWIPLALAAVWCLFRRGNRANALTLTVCLALLFVMSDAMLSHWLRPMVGRLRPTHDSLFMDAVSVYGNYRGGLYSFPSNHASNGAAAATMLILLFKRWPVALTAVTWVAGSCYSRLFLGVHWFTDVLCGLACGAAFAFCAYSIYRFAYIYYIAPLPTPASPFPESAARPFREKLPCQGYDAWPVVLTFWATVGVLVVMALR